MKNKKLITQLFQGIALISFNCNASNIAGYNGNLSEEEALQIALALSEEDNKPKVSTPTKSNTSINLNHNPVASTSTSTSTTKVQHSPKYNSIVFGGVRGSGTRWKSTDDKNSLVVNLIDSADVKANAFKISDIEVIKKKLGGQKVELLHFEKMGFGFPIAWYNVLEDIAAGKTKDQINWKFVEVPGYSKSFPDVNKAAFDYINNDSEAKNIANIYSSMLKSGGNLRYESYVKSVDLNFKDYGNPFFGNDGISHYTSLIPSLQMIVDDSSQLKKFVTNKAGFIKSGKRTLRLSSIDMVKALEKIFGSAFEANGNYKLNQNIIPEALVKDEGVYKYSRTLKSHYYLTQIYKIVLGRAGFKDIKVSIRTYIGECAQLVVEATKK